VIDKVVNEVDWWSIDGEADVMLPCMSSSHKEATHERHDDDMAYTLCCRWLLPKIWWLTQVWRMQTVYRIGDNLMIDPIGGEMGAVEAAGAGDGPMILTLEMGKSLMLRLNTDESISSTVEYR
jgi:hypothetical protein